jgi:hypothetical protein
MGKTLSAAHMLNAGRKRPPTPAETGTERLGDVATSAVDDQTSERLGDVATSAVDDQTSERLEHQTAERLEAFNKRESTQHDDPSTQQLGAQSGANGGHPATYQRATVFLTPAQRQWLKLTAKQLPDGLSASDIVRLAVSRLSQDVTRGLDLVSSLTDQAHTDAEVFSGRRNRGLPPRAEISA